MKNYLLLCCIPLLMAACQKGPYVCTCTDNGNGYGTQTYNIPGDDHSAARASCDDYARSLNSGSSSAYQCDLR